MIHLIRTLLCGLMLFVSSGSPSSWASDTVLSEPGEVDARGFFCARAHEWVAKPHEIRVCYRRDANGGTRFTFKIKNVFSSERRDWDRSLLIRFFIKAECGVGAPDQPSFPHTIGEGAVGMGVGADFFATRYEIVLPRTDEIESPLYVDFCKRSFVRAYAFAIEGEGLRSSKIVRKYPD